jgi:hypothetical protein
MAKMTKHVSNRVVQAKEAMVFIQGTSLEAFLDFYKLDYNAEELRDKFYEIFKVRHTC